jgi:hypothetical protein
MGQHGKGAWRHEGSSHRQACRVPSSRQLVPPSSRPRRRTQDCGQDCSRFFPQLPTRFTRKVLDLRVFCPRRKIFTGQAHQYLGIPPESPHTSENAEDSEHGELQTKVFAEGD